MWISRKKWEKLEKRVADIEKALQSPPEIKIDTKELSRQIREHPLRHPEEIGFSR